MSARAIVRNNGRFVPVPAAERFRRSIAVAPSGCVEWQRPLTPKGYGQFAANINGVPKMLRAHRYAWMEAHGPIPEGMHVLHRCDNPKCVNVDHLFLGTNQDNVSDKVAKGRHCFGERNGCAKLTVEKAAQIRERARRGESPTVLAREFGAHTRTVLFIRDGEQWSKAIDAYLEESA